MRTALHVPMAFQVSVNMLELFKAHMDISLYRFSFLVFRQSFSLLQLVSQPQAAIVKWKALGKGLPSRNKMSGKIKTSPVNKVFMRVARQVKLWQFCRYGTFLLLQPHLAPPGAATCWCSLWLQNWWFLRDKNCKAHSSYYQPFFFLNKLYSKFYKLLVNVQMSDNADF